VNLLSGSYGTRVALLYAYLHPERVHRSAMVGVNPPGRFVWEPGTVDAQLAYYARLWAADAGRRAGSPDLAESVRRVAHDMPRRWWLLPIDPGKVKVVTFALLFHRATAAQVLDAYLAADRGDASGLALISLAANFLLPSMFIWGDLLAKGVSADFDPTRDYAADLNPSDSILGSPIALLIWGPATPGGAWPVHRIPAELRQVRPCEVETLLISGSVDFSTPAELARDELLPSLSRGRQVILAEMGHTGDVFRLQPAAFERLLTSFYATGVADDSLYTYLPMDFGVKWGFPLLAKLLLGGAGVLALAALGVLLWLMFG
jgi:pimeloyl-ACP methyl ester carboxylesterase